MRDHKEIKYKVMNAWKEASDAARRAAIVYAFVIKIDNIIAERYKQNLEKASPFVEEARKQSKLAIEHAVSAMDLADTVESDSEANMAIEEAKKATTHIGAAEIAMEKAIFILTNDNQDDVFNTNGVNVKQLIIGQFMPYNGSAHNPFFLELSIKDYGYELLDDDNIEGVRGEAEARDILGNTGTLYWWPANEMSAKALADILIEWWGGGVITTGSTDKMVKQLKEMDIEVSDDIINIMKASEQEERDDDDW